MLNRSSVDQNAEIGANQRPQSIFPREQIQETNPDQQEGIQSIQFRKNPGVRRGEEEKCTICCTDFEDAEDVRKLPCKHLYHKECIEKWLDLKTKCPVCNREVTGLGNRIGVPPAQNNDALEHADQNEGIRSIFNNLGTIIRR